MITNIFVLITLIGLTITIGLIQKTADMISELQTNNDIIAKNIDELRYNIGLLESKIKQSSTKKKKVNDVARLKADKTQ